MSNLPSFFEWQVAVIGGGWRFPLNTSCSTLRQEPASIVLFLPHIVFCKSLIK